MATVTPAFGSGPAQIHVGGFQKASVQSVGLLDCFCGLVRLFFFFFFLVLKLICSNSVATTRSC